MSVLIRRFGWPSVVLICVTTFSVTTGNVCAEAPALADSRGKLESEYYTFSGTPAFRIKVPQGCTLGKRSDPNAQVVSLRTREGVTVEASVAAVDETFHASHGGPLYFGILSKVIGKNHQFLAQKKISLDNDHEGYRTDISWTIGETQIHTVLISVFAEGHWVFIAAHPVDNVEQFAKIAESLSLQ